MTVFILIVRWIMKTNQKSIRMTDEVFQAINEYRGNGFNEKLENMVLDFLKGRDKMVRETELLQSYISDKRIEMRQVQQQLQKMREVEPRVRSLVDAVIALVDVR